MGYLGCNRSVTAWTLLPQVPWVTLRLGAARTDGGRCAQLTSRRGRRESEQGKEGNIGMATSSGAAAGGGLSSTDLQIGWQYRAACKGSVSNLFLPPNPLEPRGGGGRGAPRQGDLPHLPGAGGVPRVRPAGPGAPRHLGRAQRVRAPPAPGSPRRLTGSLRSPSAERWGGPWTPGRTRPSPCCPTTPSRSSTTGVTTAGSWSPSTPPRSAARSPSSSGPRASPTPCGNPARDVAVGR